MFKKILMAGLILGLVWTFTAIPAEVKAAETIKIGVVNVQKVIAQSTKGQEIKNKIIQRRNAVMKDLELRQNEIEKAKAEFLRQASIMDPDVVYERRKTIERKERDLKTQLNDFSVDIQAEEARIMKPLLVAIDQVLQALGKEKGFTVILDKSRSGVIYFPDSIDLTDEVIKRFNAAQ